jgi:hypothetical protein
VRAVTHVHVQGTTSKRASERGGGGGKRERDLKEAALVIKGACEHFVVLLQHRLQL